jgi:hypothetical protein
MMKDQVGPQLGNVMVSTTQNRGHAPEFWAEQATRKICGISDNADPHVRKQALAFRDKIYAVILAEMRSAIRSDRVTLSNQMRARGVNDLAQIIREL